MPVPLFGKTFLLPVAFTKSLGKIQPLQWFG
jgi:hypothetical protein